MLKVIKTSALLAVVLLLSVPVCAGGDGFGLEDSFGLFDTAKSYKTYITAMREQGIIPTYRAAQEYIAAQATAAAAQEAATAAAAAAAATQAIAAAKPVSFASRLAAGLSRTRQAIPTLQDVKNAGHNGLAVAKRGFSAVGQKTANLGQEAYKRALPAAQASLRFAGQHSTAIKVASGVFAAAGLTFAGYKAVKAVLARSKKAKDQVVAAAAATPAQQQAAAIAQELPKNGMFRRRSGAQATAAQVQEAAQACTQAIHDIYEAGKELNAAPDAQRATALAKYETAKGAYINRMATCKLPENAKELQLQFVGACQDTFNLVAKHANCAAANDALITGAIAALTRCSADICTLIK